MSASLGFYLIDNWLSLTFESICLSVSSYLSHSWIGKRREKSIIIIALLWTCSRCKNFDLIHYYYWESTTLVRTSRWTRLQVVLAGHRLSRIPSPQPQHSCLLLKKEFVERKMYLEYLFLFNYSKRVSKQTSFVHTLMRSFMRHATSPHLAICPQNREH